MTTNEFFDGFRDFLAEDEQTKPFVDTFKTTLMDQTSDKYNNRLLTRTGYRVALIFFEQYGKTHKEFENPKCFYAFIDWNKRNLEKIKEKITKEYDSIMYIGKENCDDKCNFIIYDENFITEVDLFGGIEQFLDSLEGGL